jgi:hypothetical protein
MQESMPDIQEEAVNEMKNEILEQMMETKNEKD